MTDRQAAEAREWAQYLDNQGGIRDPTTARHLFGVADAVDALSARIAALEAQCAQAEQERDEAREAANEAFAAVTEARAEVADARERVRAVLADGAASGGREAPDTKEPT